MLQMAPQAAFIKDKNGLLPIHVACSRHCSVPKLEMLLKEYPKSVAEKTKDGATPLDLAIRTATVSRPNLVLIDGLRKIMDADGAAEQGPAKKARVFAVI
jgi:hypothetical protein